MGILGRPPGFDPLLCVAVVVGGAVSQADPGSLLTSVTPAWRSALWHVAFGAGWGPNTTMADQLVMFEVVSEWTGALRRAVPQSGAYFCESGA